MCVVPSVMKAQCSGGIVNAHTISKSANLKALAVSGHVYGFKPTMQSLIKNNGKIVPELIGIGKASTFTGFCAFHDKGIFQEIEDEEMHFTASQCFKLAYRAVGRETYLKQNTAGIEPTIRASDRGMPIHAQRAIQSFASGFFEGVSLGSQDSGYHKSLYDSVLVTEDYANVRKCVIEFSSTPTVMCSGGIFPEFDFQGRTLQVLGRASRNIGVINFNVVATPTGGAVVFTWLESPESASCTALVESLILLPHDQITNALIRFFFEHCENTFMAPAWWDALPARTREALVARMNYSASPMNARSATCLTNDGFTYADWGIVNITR